MIWLGLLILLTCIVVGARVGGIGLAAVSMDQTGTTRIGTYFLNHSFMLPGLVSTVASTVTALVLSSLLVQ